jgi:hypothetical protein
LKRERFTAGPTEPKKSWCDRAELAALFIRDGEVVCDLGSGSQVLSRFLPPNSGYVPVDRDLSTPGTFACDFNDEHFTLPTDRIDVIVALGLLNWLDDLHLFMTRLGELCPDRFIIFTYDFWKRREGAASALVELQDGASFFSKHIRNLAVPSVFRRRAMFTGTIGSGAPGLPARASATRLTCRQIRPQDYLAMRIFDIDMIPRWFA